MLQQSKMNRTAHVDTFLHKIATRECKVAIIGLGYVGLPLAEAFVENGLDVVGYDTDTSKVETLKQRGSPMRHFSGEKIGGLLDSGRFEPISDPALFASPDVFILCVPTPLTKSGDPDLSYVLSATQIIASQLVAGQLVVLESTTFPGTSEEIIKPILEKGSGLREGEDFAIAYSPEREDPGNPNFTTRSIPKIVGADSCMGRDMAISLYEVAVNTVVPVANMRTAEASKLMENIFRHVNIGLVNELKTVFESMDVDIWDVVEAAKTKPFGYMPFYPGPGTGGHCIPVDPKYLSWKAKTVGEATRFIDLASAINERMPEQIVERASKALRAHADKPLDISRVLILGISYKANIDDLRESPALEVWKLLESAGAHVDYHDTFIPEISTQKGHMFNKTSISLKTENIQSYDIILITTNHRDVDYDHLVNTASLILDTRNALQSKAHNSRARIVKA